MSLTYADTLAAKKSSESFNVGIPTLCRYDLLDRCITSILASTKQPEKILIVDNGGKFDPPSHYKSRLEIVRPGYNLGVPQSWNFIQRYFGDQDTYILNDDIFVTPTTFEVCQGMPGWLVTGFQFGCFCVRQLCRDLIGEFDEALWPMYWEDYDYVNRMCLAIDDPTGFPDVRPYHISPGAVISAQDYPDARPENFQLGAKSEQGWMFPFKDRIRNRYGRKWGNNEFAKPIHKKPYGDGVGDSPLTEYWNVLRENRANEVFMDKLRDHIDEYYTFVELVGKDDVGLASVTSLLHGDEYRWFAPDRRPEWDIIPNLARHECYEFEVRTSFRADELCFPNVDVLIVGKQPAELQKQFIQYANRVSSTIVICGYSDLIPEDAFGPWMRVSRDEDLTVFRRN